MVRLCAHHVCDDCNGVCICWGPTSCSTSFFIAWRYHHFHPSGLLAFVFVSNISYIDTQPKVDSVWQKSQVLYINVSDFKHVSSLTYCLCFYIKFPITFVNYPKMCIFFLKQWINAFLNKSKCPRKNSLILARSLNFLF